MKKKNNNFFTLTRKADGGFTLVELIVVIAILAILAGAAVPAYSGYINKANEAADQQLLAALNTAYAAACMENGEFDMTQLAKKPVASKIRENVTIEPYNVSFKNYFGDSVFKYYGTLTFDTATGVFTGNSVADLIKALQNAWNGTSFDDGTGEVAKVLLGTFDKIGGYFSDIAALVGDEGLGVGEELINMAGDFVGALGLVEMFDGLNGAMNMTDAEMEAYLAEKGIPEEDWGKYKATMKGNAAVLYFADDAAGRTVEEVQTSLGNFITLMGTANNSAWQSENLKTIDFVNAYLSSDAELSESEREAFLQAAKNGVFTSEQRDALDEFNNKIAFSMGDLKLTGAELVAMNKAAEQLGTTNDAGISTLGSMYALAAGYYNSDAYKNSATYDPDYKPAFSDFGTVMDAVNDPGFSEYYNGKDGNPGQATADLEAYLKFMGYISSGEIDMSDPKAFAGEYADIAKALGFTN